MTGTDEHGQKIEGKAKDAGKTPKEFVDEVVGEIHTIWDLMDTSYDKFMRTTEEYHEKQVQKMFRKMYENGDIYKGKYEAGTVLPVSPSGPILSLWTENVRIAEERWRSPVRMPTSLRCPSMRTV